MCTLCKKVHYTGFAMKESFARRKADLLPEVNLLCWRRELCRFDCEFCQSRREFLGTYELVSHYQEIERLVHNSSEIKLYVACQNLGDGCNVVQRLPRDSTVQNWYHTDQKDIRSERLPTQQTPAKTDLCQTRYCPCVLIILWKKKYTLYISNYPET